MMPQPGLPNLVKYCRSAAAGLEERIAARKNPRRETVDNLRALADTWRDWADDLELLMARAGGANGKGWGE